MLHWWLIPAFAVFLIVVWGFYFLLKFTGGSGVRTEGRTLVDKPDEEQPFEERE